MEAEDRPAGEGERGHEVKATVINCSEPHYNLGAAKLARWLRAGGYEVTANSLGDADLACLSVIFSWDAPRAAAIARMYRKRGVEVWAGGPGLFGNPANGYKQRTWWREQTGFDAHVGIDWRFERQRGEYRMIFSTRGCPRNCHYCIVTPMEGSEFRYDQEFSPAPVLMDNNLSETPVEVQESIIQRYNLAGVPLIDANSGFEPEPFDNGTYNRWKPLLRGPWRTAFDILPEWRNVKKTLDVLRHEAARRKQVYVLIGNEPVESCLERAVKTIEWGAEPFCQPLLALDAPSRRSFVLRFDWTAEKLVHFARFFNSHLWRGPNGTRRSIQEYRLGKIAPFVDLKRPAFSIL